MLGQSQVQRRLSGSVLPYRGKDGKRHHYKTMSPEQWGMRMKRKSDVKIVTLAMSAHSVTTKVSGGTMC